MKRRMILICIVVLAVLMAVTAASAQAVHVPWTGSEELIDILDFGVTTSPGGRQHFRGMVELLRAEASDPRAAGLNRVVVNGNLDAEGFGHVWGTNRLDVDAPGHGYWEGTWTGKIDESGIALKMQGRGYEDLDGLLLSGTMVNMVTEGVIIELPSQ